MPQILEMKEIDGELWCRVGVPGDFPSGVALWTPDEQEKFKKGTTRDLIADIEFDAGVAHDDYNDRNRARFLSAVAEEIEKRVNA